MGLVSSIRTLRDYIFHRSRIEHEMDEEFRLHLASRAADLERQGVPKAEAERQARIEFGGYQNYKEECRETLGTRLLEELWQDIRYGLRQLRRNPGFTIVAVLTLALGIGANTAIFSAVDAVLLRPLPFSQPERLVSVLSVQIPRGNGREASYPDFLDWRARSHAFDQMAVYRTENFTLKSGGEPAHISGAVVSADLFSLLGVTPRLGRTFLRGDDVPGSVNGTDAVILSYGFWQARFGSDQHVVGRALNLDGRAFTVVGVAPPGFQFPIRGEPIDLWATIAVDMPSGGNGMATERGAHYLDVIARLKPKVTFAQAQAEMNSIVGTLNEQYPNIHPRAARVVPELDGLAGPARPGLLILLAAVGCLLLIACANVANLLLARATARRREMFIRAALGAGRGRVIRQVLTESILLSLLGGLVGLLLGLRGVNLLVRIVPADIPRLAQASLDGRVLVFVTAVSALTAFLFGLAPALAGSKFDLVGSLKESGQGHSLRLHQTRTHGALVIGEVAMALVLLASAGLLIRSFISLASADPGFDAHHVLTLRLDSPPHYSHAQQPQFFSDVLGRVRSLPGVRSVSGVFGLPFSEVDARTGFAIEGQPVAEANRPQTAYVAVEPHYFRTLGIPLEKGRDFTAHDDLASAPVAIINETLARRYFPHQDPIGQRIQPGISNGYGKKQPLREIVGVVGDVKLHDLAASAGPQCYVPSAQSPLGLLTVVVRTDGDPLSLAPAVRSVVASANKEVTVYNVATLQQLISRSVAAPRFLTLFLGMFASLAVLLAAVGLYGLVSYSVSLRTRELGIRMALGAEKRDVVRMVIGQGLRLTLIGVAIGVAGALALTRFLSSLLYGVKPTDPLTFIAVSLILIAVALVACYIPARRAAKVDPMVALRYE
jgi:putative ABC transport system permease protein